MFTSGGLERVYAYLSPEVKDALRKLAYERRSSISALVAEAVDAYLEEQSKPKK